MKRALLLGAYGQTNLGDDLLMVTYLNLLKRWGAQEVHVNVADPQYVPAEVLADTSLRVVYHTTYQTSMITWLNVIRRIDVLVYGGGTLFKELPQGTGRDKYSVIVRTLLLNIFARLFGKRILHLHIGIGKLDTRLGRWITKMALRLSHLTIFRDRQSYDFAQKNLHLRSSSSYCYTDALFTDETFLAFQQPMVFPVIPKNTDHVIGMNIVGTSLLPDDYDRDVYRQELLSTVRQLIAENNFVILVPFQHQFDPANDHVFMREQIWSQLSEDERQKVHLLDELPLRQVVSFFDAIDIFVAMRFHSVLLACVTQTPYISIEYDSKCARFNSEAGYPYRVDIAGFTQSCFAQVYSLLLDNLTAARQLLTTMTQTHRRLGKESLQVIAASLELSENNG